MALLFFVRLHTRAGVDGELKVAIDDQQVADDTMLFMSPGNFVSERSSGRSGMRRPGERSSDGMCLAH
jgi:hypothetical protein